MSTDGIPKFASATLSLCLLIISIGFTRFLWFATDITIQSANVTLQAARKEKEESMQLVKVSKQQINGALEESTRMREWFKTKVADAPLSAAAQSSTQPRTVLSEVTPRLNTQIEKLQRQKEILDQYESALK